MNAAKQLLPPAPDVGHCAAWRFEPTSVHMRIIRHVLAHSECKMEQTYFRQE